MNLKPILTGDNSPTLFSERFGEHYHSTSMGAHSESLHKHILPPLLVHPEWLNRSKIKILDICFGLGYNTLATLALYRQKGFKGIIEVHSPEMDEELLEGLLYFDYPLELGETRSFLYELIQKKRVERDGVILELFVGDAREYLRMLEGGFDIVYQDAFSPVKNPLLWTVDYFSDLRAILVEEGVVTTYTQSSAVRYSAYLAGFQVYAYENGIDRGGTLFSPSSLPLKRIDLEEKRLNNPSLKALRDEDYCVN